MGLLPLEVLGKKKEVCDAMGLVCCELTTLWVARLNDGAELKVTDPKEQQRDVEEKEAEG